MPPGKGSRDQASARGRAVPIDISIDEDRALVIHTCSGDMTYDDFVGAVDAAPAFPGYRPGFSDLWIASDSNWSALTADHVQNLIEYFEQKIADGRPHPPKTAFVATDDLNYGLSRQYMARSDGILPGAYRTFRSKDEAVLWLLSDSAD